MNVMKRGRRGLLLLSAALLLPGCGAQTDPVSSRPGPEPVSAGTQSAAPEKEAVRLLTETYHYPDGSVNWVKTYSYDENGNCTAVDTDDRSGDEWSMSTANTYDDRGNLTEVSTWERELLISQEWNTYDAENRLVSHHRDWDGMPDRDETYAYDARGRKITTESTSYQTGDPGYRKSVISHTYDANGKILRQEENGEWLDGESQWEIEETENERHTWKRWTDYSYDSAGRLTSESSASDDGTQWGMAYLYDDAGNLTQTQDEHGAKTEYRYDRDGNCTEERIYGTEGERSCDITYIYEPIPKN